MSNIIILPMKGKIIPITEVPDKIFSNKMLGDGFAMIPEDGLVVSPVNGSIVKIFPTNHGIVLLAEDGTEVLIHIGIDTVVLGGKGFKKLVNEGDTVTSGQSLLQVDLDYLEDHNISAVTPIVLTNLEEGKRVVLHDNQVTIE